jgi:hypothetical protein
VNAEGLLENSGGRGLPEPLPAGERVLWQGSPRWQTLWRRAFHARGMAIYFGLIVAWCAISSIAKGVPVEAIAISTAKLTGLSLVPIALGALYCWGLQRTTIYTITSRRVVMSFGIALPMSFNLPFTRIEAAGLKTNPDGTGDIPLRLLAGEKMAYFVAWPHARPWRMARTEPMLRCIPDADGAAAILARALAANLAATAAFTAMSADRRPAQAVPARQGHVAQPA